MIVWSWQLDSSLLSMCWRSMYRRSFFDDLMRSSLIAICRYGSTSFTVSTASTIHGFAGSFESVLYKVRISSYLTRCSSVCCRIIYRILRLTADFKFPCLFSQDVMISIAPQSHSPGMFSWFPLFIPLAVPLRVNVGDNIVINIWRWQQFKQSATINNTDK